MADVHSKEQRSRNMSAIKGKNTKPEISLRKILWSKGLRYRLKNKLPGKPDLVFPSVRLVIFVDGCFWHKCPTHFNHPKTNPEFWDKKISGNVIRDEVVNRNLKDAGWIVLRFWEHEIKKDAKSVSTKIEQKIKALRQRS